MRLGCRLDSGSLSTSRSGARVARHAASSSRYVSVPSDSSAAESARSRPGWVMPTRHVPSSSSSTTTCGARERGVDARLQGLVVPDAPDRQQRRGEVVAAG